MNIKLILIILLVTTFLVNSKAQDVHFTSYDFSPLTLNPALAGGFSGSYRIGGIYRDQWASVSGSGAFRTPTIHIDVPIIRGIRKQDWVGLGIGVFNDHSSVYNLVYNKSFQGVSYHLALDKKQQRIIAFGIQNGTATRRIDLKGRDLRTETYILAGLDSNGASLDPNSAVENGYLTSGGGTITDWVGGVTFSSYQKNLSFIRAGFAVGRIPRDNQGFAKSQDRQNLKFTGFALYDTPISGNLFLTPSILYQQIGNNFEFVGQTKLGYLLSEEKGIFGNVGLGYRWRDAVQFLVGMDYKDIKVQLAYDLNASGLTAASRSIGAFEIAVSYIGKVYKKPKVDPTQVCPRL